MIPRSSVSFWVISLGLILALSSAVQAQQPYYYGPGGVPGPAAAGPGMDYTAPGAYGMAPDAPPGTRGPIVARPFTAQPPRVLLGERMKEEGVDLEYVDVEAFTGMPIAADQIPRVNTLEEYRKVLSEQVPAIFFDGKIYIYHAKTDSFRPRDWEIQEHNEQLWDEIESERQAAMRALAQQRMQTRLGAWRAQQAQMRAVMGNQPGYPPGAGTPGFAPGAMPPTGRARAARRGR